MSTSYRIRYRPRSRYRGGSNGLVLFETAFIVAIATGIYRRSENAKLGDMVQVWILARHTNPWLAQQNGQDRLVCGECPLRPANPDRPVRCYVETHHAPGHVWRSYQRGSYRPYVSPEAFRGRAVRFGAYGDPVHLPLPLVAEIASVASLWTGYTHQWRNELCQGYRPYFMASCDSVDEQIEASCAGWRTYRIAPRRSTWRLIDERRCPASKEAGYLTTCERCGECRGTLKPGPNVVIQAH